MESTLHTDLLNCDESLAWTNQSYLDFGPLSPSDAGVFQSAVSWKEPDSLYQTSDRPASEEGYIMSDRCLDKAMRDLTGRVPEHAGAFFGPVCSQSLITCYRSFKPNGTPVMFSVDGSEVMKLMKSLKPRGLELKGFVHSHPAGVYELSQGDRRYVKQLLANPKNTDDTIFMPLVCDGRFLPFVVDRTGIVTRPKFETFDCRA